MVNEIINEKLLSHNRFYYDKKTVLEFLNYLKTVAPVFAPHRKGEMSFSYEQVKDINDVVFNYPRTMQSIKKYFLPPKETLLTFNRGDNYYHKRKIIPEERIFFGIHSYEMQALKCLDYCFSHGNPESNYLIRRQNAIFIGIDYIPDKWHFSKSLGIDIETLDGFDLFFCTMDDGFVVFEGNEQGAWLLKDFGKGEPYNDHPFKIRDREFKTKIRYHHNRLPQIFDHLQKSKVWDKYAERCVGCATCNLLCATCYCFDIRDEVELDAENGYRSRSWDGCMLNTFAEVAGGENFRATLAARTRHRLYRKFKYLADKSEFMHCVGCGRCSRYCPAGISITEIVNDLIEDYENKQKHELI